MSTPSQLELSVLYTPQGRGPTATSGGVDVVPRIYTPVIPRASLRFKRRTPAATPDWLQRLIHERRHRGVGEIPAALFTYCRPVTRL